MKTTAQKKFKKVRSTWYLWLFPFFALLISAGLFYQFLQLRGPEIRVSFEDASGIQPDKTRVRFRGVTIGLVENVTISDDKKNVIAHVRLQKPFKDFAVKGSKYSLVLPKVGFQGVSGLETLFEGTYIAAIPGNASNSVERDFKGAIGAETAEPLDDTFPYYLQTDRLGSVSMGDPVTYRGLAIGNVTQINLAQDSRSLVVQVNVQKRYAKVIRQNSVFWRKVGIQANLGLFKSEVKISSLESLMKGGIDVATPNEPGAIANAHSRFSLSEAAPKDWEKWNPALEFKE